MRCASHVGNCAIEYTEPRRLMSTSMRVGCCMLICATSIATERYIGPYVLGRVASAMFCPSSWTVWIIIPNFESHNGRADSQAPGRATPTRMLI